MSSATLPSALDPQTQAFPTLTPAQIDRIRPLGRVRTVESGEVLFEPSGETIPFYVVLSGELKIVQPSLDGERAIVTHGAGEFSGEISMISGQRSLVRGLVSAPGDFLELDNDAMRTVVARDAELSEILLRAFILRRLALIKEGYGNLVVLGSRHSAQTLELREFLSRNAHPYTYIDLDTDANSQALLDRFEVKPSEVPVVICNGGMVLRSPSIQKLAQCLRLNTTIDATHIRDLVIVGAGPSGLAAAVYAASEGLDVVMVETIAPGGQAGSSSKIENYLGFPTGVSGQELAARATTQAQKFGASMMIARTIVQLECEHQPYRVILDSGDVMLTRAIVIATGAQYNKPKLSNLERFEGNGIYYGATYIESQLCNDEEVIVVGGANSAGQAAVFLSQTARKVHLLVRSGELSSTMSRYLIQRLVENPQIDLHLQTEIVGLEGESRLEVVKWRNKTTGEVSAHAIQHVFVMTGASPRTQWLQGCLALDDKGFILTGRDVESLNGGPNGPKWPLKRTPQMLETSLPGVFAVGDVRSGNVKRVASAVGEGAIAVHMVHRNLAEL
ncbi:MAG: FAD-dependent oxidoreductase [Bryobacteraceae bacterium]